MIKIEIVAFIAGLICLGIYLSVSLEMRALSVIFIITIIFDLILVFYATRALDLLFIPSKLFITRIFPFRKSSIYNYYYSIITITLIVEAYFYFLYDKKELLNEKLKRVLIGNEAALILLPLSWLSTRIGIFYR